MKTNKTVEMDFISLLNRNSKILYRVCWMFFRSDEYDFGELRQEIVYALWKEYSKHGTSRYGHSCKESTWVYSIAWRAALNYKRDYCSKINNIDFMPQLSEKIATTEDDEDLLRDLISKLDTDDKRWISYYLDRDRYSTIAEIENTTEVAARKKMSRIIQKLKKIVGLF